MPDDARPLNIETSLGGQGFAVTAPVQPAIHLEEERTVDGEPIAGHGDATAPCHVASRGPGRWAHRSLHLCPHHPPDLAVISRRQPAQQEVSVALQDRERDWDFLERHRDLVFQARGIRLDSPLCDKVQALAEDIWTFRREIQKPGGNDFKRSIPWSHPVDTLIYGSWCLGGAYALIGLCATMGVPAREVSMYGHSGAEVWMEGRWCYVESIKRFGEHGRNLHDRGFAELVLDPYRAEYGLCPEQQAMYWQTWVQRISNPANGLWMHQHAITAFHPGSAPALYPGWPEPRFKSDHPRRYALLPCEHGRAHPGLILRRGQAFRRRVWLGSLAETAGITATCRGADAGAWPGHRVPRDGGDWYVAVNGRRRPVRDLGGFDLPPRNWTWAFDLPLTDLREHAWNTVEIGCPGSGGEWLAFTGASDPLCADEACLVPAVAG